MDNDLYEREVKIPCRTNPLAAREGLDMVLLVPRHFEDNWLFDFQALPLRAQGSSLRLRVTDHGNWLTFKAAPEDHSWLKVREEIETEVNNPEAMRSILESLGMKPVFRYQKFRTVFHVDLSNTSKVTAMYDETPLGNFLELEGDESSIEMLLKELQPPTQSLLKSSYIALWMERLRAQGLPMQDMVFTSGEHIED